MAATAKTRHNHELLPFGAYVDEGQCPRCDQLRDEKRANGETPHNHAPTAWGKRVDGCPRCIELAGGAPKRLSQADRQAEWDRKRSAEIAAHTNENCHYMTKHTHRDPITGQTFISWSGCCVCFDW